MTEAAISIQNLSKTYAGGKRALDDVSIDVPRGQIFGLLGPNGAGKSTLINILAGLVNKTQGSATIWGFDIDKHPRNAKASIGIVNQEILFDPFFTPFETLEIQAGLYGVPKAQRRTMELLRAVHLEDKANALCAYAVGGHEAPPDGRQGHDAFAARAGARRTDGGGRYRASPAIMDLCPPASTNDGVTVVLTTHYLEEAEQLCDRIAIINNGRVIANEPTRELVGKAQEKIVAVTVDRDVAAVPQAMSLREDRAEGYADAGDHLRQEPGECGRGAGRGAGGRLRDRRRVDEGSGSGGCLPQPHAGGERGLIEARRDPSEGSSPPFFHRRRRCRRSTGVRPVGRA